MKKLTILVLLLVMTTVLMTGCATLFGLAPKTLETYSAEAATFRELNVKWNEVRGATGYIVLISETEGGTYREAAKVSSSVKTTTVTGLRGNTTYWFKIVAELKKDGPVESKLFSATTLREVAPAKPASLTARASNPSSIIATWTRAIGEESYKVYISTTAASGYRLAGDNINADRFLVRNLQPNTTYFVRLEAVNRFGSSPQSDPVEATSGRSQEEIDAERAAAAAEREAAAAAQRAEREAAQAAERERLEREAPLNNAAIARLRGTWVGSVTALGQTVNVELRFTSNTEVLYVTSPGPNETVSRRSFTVTGGGTALSIDRNEPMNFTISGNTLTISGGGAAGASYRGMYTRR